ncbi:MAG: adenylate/guanylate cyclase domain-containing protein [Rhodospirillales bacterium]
MIGRLRLYSGLLLFVYVTGHLINHMAGIISLDAMNAANRVLAAPWRSLPGTVLLCGALVVHVTLAFYGLYARRRLNLRRWEWAQLTLGVTLPLLLAVHVFGTRVVDEVAGQRVDYIAIMVILWVLKPVNGVIQAVALLAAWGHGCIGVHMWLRLKPWYAGWRWLALSFGVLIPALSLAGYVAAGMEVLSLAETEGWVSRVLQAHGRSNEMAAFAIAGETWTQIGVVAVLATILAARFVRRQIESRRAGPVIRYVPGDADIPVVPGGTALEAIRAVGIRHASVCGGRGRCSTCRIRVIHGREGLAPPAEGEQRVLARLGLGAGHVRLACQVRPVADISVAALLPPDDPGPDMATSRDHRRGEEAEVAVLFVDLRGSTKLSEDRLPFDVVFILNQFFAELSAALEETGGHYAQFNGDGLMAIYGLDTDPGRACRDALAGAAAMFRRIEALSARLAGELSEPLRIGIGIHVGEAIVGSMGPPKTPIVSALGDNVNIAARLEAMTKELGTRICASARVLETAGYDIDGMTIHELPVKGRSRPVRVVGFDDPPPVQG